MCPQRPEDPRRQHDREVTVQNLGRSINFYDLALGFEVVHLVCDAHTRCAVLRDGDGNRIVLREGEAAALPGAVRLKLFAAGFDERRAHLWDLGIPASRESGAADRTFGGGDWRLFYFHDPDGNELRLVGKPPRRLRHVPIR